MTSLVELIVPNDEPSVTSPSESGVQLDPLLRVRRARLWGVTAAILTLCGLGAVAATHAHVAIQVVAGLALALTLGSLLEWYLHVYLTHFDRGFQRVLFEQHHLTHHRLGGPPRKKSLAHCVTEQFLGQLVAGLLCVAAPLYLLTWSLGIAAGAVAASLGMSLMIAVLHHAYHGELRLPFDRMRWFGFLRRQHLHHHADLGVNLNVVLPLADLCLGTFSSKPEGTCTAASPDSQVSHVPT